LVIQVGNSVSFFNLGGEVGVGRTMTFTQALSTRTPHHMIAHAIGIALGLATFEIWWAGIGLE
jgi:hypothetical protein